MTRIFQPTSGGVVAGRGGISPIGTSSPNSGSTGNTNSAYAPGAFTSGVNVQGTATAYTVENTDYQGLILFDTASAVAVSLNPALGENFTTTILNIGTGAITLTPIVPTGGTGLYTVNGASSLTLPSGAGCIVAFAQRLWYAYVGTTFIPTFANISGTLSLAQLPTAGLTATVALAKLTGGGTNGTATFTNGLLVSYIAPT